MQETSINLPFLTVEGPGGRWHLDLRTVALEARADDGAPLVDPDDGARPQGSPGRQEAAEGHHVEVVLVGGSTRIPLVKETVKKFFGKDPASGVSPDRSRRRPQRGRSGGRPLGRRQGHASLLDVAPPIRLRVQEDPDRRHDGDDPAQHDDPHPEEGSLLDGDRNGQPFEQSKVRSCKASEPSPCCVTILVRSGSSTSKASCRRRAAFRRSK